MNEQKQTLTDQILKIFDPINQVSIRLLQMDIESLICDNPEASDKLIQLLSHYDKVFHAGNILAMRTIKQMQKIELLNHEIETSKNQIEILNQHDNS